MKLERCMANPILTPIPWHDWENRFVFNPAVVYDGELFHMIYRAQGTDMISRFGYAVSTDGIHFNRLENLFLNLQAMMNFLVLKIRE